MSLPIEEVGKQAVDAMTSASKAASDMCKQMASQLGMSSNQPVAFELPLANALQTPPLALVRRGVPVDIVTECCALHEMVFMPLQGATNPAATLLAIRGQGSLDQVLGRSVWLEGSARWCGDGMGFMLEIPRRRAYTDARAEGQLAAVLPFSTLKGIPLRWKLPACGHMALMAGLVHQAPSIGHNLDGLPQGATLVLGTRLCFATLAGHICGLQLRGMLQEGNTPAQDRRYTLRAGRVPNQHVAGWKLGGIEASMMWLEAQRRAQLCGKVMVERGAQQSRIHWHGSLVCWPASDLFSSNDPLRPGPWGFGVQLAGSSQRAAMLTGAAILELQRDAMQDSQRWLTLTATQSGNITASYSTVNSAGSSIHLPLSPPISVHSFKYNFSLTCPTGWATQNLSLDSFRIGINYAIDV